LYDGFLLEVDTDEDIVFPPVVGEALEPDVAKEEEPVQHAVGNDPDDSGDDSSSSENSSSEEEDENEDEDEDNEDVDIEGLEDDNSVIANRMVATTMKIRMGMNKAMSIGTTRLSTMSTLMLVQMVCFASCWRSCCRT
jgi:hypothetical protein